MKALVTGACGFIGSHLVQKLIKEGHDVKAMAHYNSSGSDGWLDTIQEKPEIIRGDIGDGGFIYQSCKDVEVVYHLAALISIPYSYQAPKSYINTNIIGTYNILEACKDKRCMITSTSEVYGTAQTDKIDITHRRFPQSPYAATKVAADALALSYFNTYHTPVTIVRPFNAFGPRQSLRAVIPQIIIQALQGDTITIGNTNSTRDFNYVHDLVDAMIDIMSSKYNMGKELNIATEHDISINEIIGHVESILHTEFTVVIDKSRFRPESSEVDRLCGKSSVNHKITDFHEALKQTIDWYKENMHYFKKGYAI